MMLRDFDAADEAVAALDWARTPAGVAIDRAIDQLCFGQKDPQPPLSRYSADARAALRLLDSLSARWHDDAVRVFAVELLRSTAGDPNRWWRCILGGQGWYAEGYADSLPLAICRAALDFGRAA